MSFIAGVQASSACDILTGGSDTTPVRVRHQSWMIPGEVTFTAAMLLVMCGLSLFFKLPILLPSLRSAAFVGFHYLYPLLGLAICGACTAVASRDVRKIWMLLGSLPCYALVLWVHFNIKLWAPIVNPHTFDSSYWVIDQFGSGLIQQCMAARIWLTRYISFDTNMYMYAFIMLFYFSFCYHAWRTPEAFRKVFLSALVFQGLGAIAYLLFPAVGPFLYQHGVSPNVTQAQQHMLSIHEHLVRGGVDWLNANGRDALLAGLGAMPSLHAGGTFLFVWFAFRHARVLLPIYIPIFGFILISAIANRWHYLIDLPMGILLAVFSIWLANRLDLQSSKATSTVAPSPFNPAFR